MASMQHHLMTRRGFCLCCIASTTFGASGGCLSPKEVFAQARIGSAFFTRLVYAGV